MNRLTEPLNSIESGTQGQGKPSKVLIWNNKLIKCGIFLLILNLIVSIVALVAFGFFVSGVRSAYIDANATINDVMHNVTSSMGIMPQVSKLVRTNLDLTTWRSLLEDASSKLEQVGILFFHFFASVFLLPLLLH